MKTQYLYSRKQKSLIGSLLIYLLVYSILCVLETFLQGLLYSWGQIDSQIEFGGNMRWERMSQREIRADNRISKLGEIQK